MDDFLHNLRTGKFRRGNTDRRQHDNPQYRGTEKRGGKDRRDAAQRRPVPPERMLSLFMEALPEFKNFLETFLENQKRLTEIDERRVQSDERKAEALESIAEYFKHLAQSGHGAAKEERGGPKFSMEPEAWAGHQEARKHAAADRDKVMEIINALRSEGASYENIAQNLDSQGIPTFSGKGRWHGQTVQKLYTQLTGLM